MSSSKRARPASVRETEIRDKYCKCSLCIVQDPVSGVLQPHTTYYRHNRCDKRKQARLVAEQNAPSHLFGSEREDHIRSVLAAGSAGDDDNIHGGGGDFEGDLDDEHSAEDAKQAIQDPEGDDLDDDDREVLERARAIIAERSSPPMDDVGSDADVDDVEYQEHVADGIDNDSDSADNDVDAAAAAVALPLPFVALAPDAAAAIPYQHPADAGTPLYAGATVSKQQAVAALLGLAAENQLSQTATAGLFKTVSHLLPRGHSFPLFSTLERTAAREMRANTIKIPMCTNGCELFWNDPGDPNYQCANATKCRICLTPRPVDRQPEKVFVGCVVTWFACS